WDSTRLSKHPLRGRSTSFGEGEPKGASGSPGARPGLPAAARKRRPSLFGGLPLWEDLSFFWADPLSFGEPSSIWERGRLSWETPPLFGRGPVFFGSPLVHLGRGVVFLGRPLVFFGRSLSPNSEAQPSRRTLYSVSFWRGDRHEPIVP